MDELTIGFLTMDDRPLTIGGQWSMVKNSKQWSIVGGQWSEKQSSAVNGRRSMVGKTVKQWSMVGGQWSEKQSSAANGRRSIVGSQWSNENI
jgi:hypothetical protein